MTDRHAMRDHSRTLYLSIRTSSRLEDDFVDFVVPQVYDTLSIGPWASAKCYWVLPAAVFGATGATWSWL